MSRSAVERPPMLGRWGSSCPMSSIETRIPSHQRHLTVRYGDLSVSIRGRTDIDGDGALQTSESTF